MGGASCTGNEFRVYCTISCLLHWVRVSYIKLHHFKMNLHNPVHQNIETPVNVQAAMLLVQQTHKQAFMHEEASQTLQTDCLPSSREELSAPQDGLAALLHRRKVLSSWMPAT